MTQCKIETVLKSPGPGLSNAQRNVHCALCTQLYLKQIFLKLYYRGSHTSKSEYSRNICRQSLHWSRGVLPYGKWRGGRDQRSYAPSPDSTITVPVQISDTQQSRATESSFADAYRENSSDADFKHTGNPIKKGGMFYKKRIHSNIAEEDEEAAAESRKIKFI